MASTVNTEKHVISMRVSHKAGVLIRIVLVFSRRGYNIDSLVVSEANDKRFANLTIVFTGERAGLGQIIKQLNKLIDVVHAVDHTGQNIVSREMALFKIRADTKARGGLLQLANALRCEVIEVDEKTVLIECSGSSAHIDSVKSVFQEYGILELVRTGKVIMAPGETPTF